MTTDAATRINITLPPLHPTQSVIAKHPARFKVVNCGRRYGKTMLGIVCCLRSALKGGRVWWVAPSYKQALEGWSYLQRLVTQMPVTLARTHVTELKVEFTGGGSIQVRTGDNPDMLRGAGLDGVVLDEAATMKRDVWDLVLRPALADKRGWAMFISTPQHFNWFFDLYTQAEGLQNDEWAAWTHPTWDNPFIEESEIEALRAEMTPEDFDQECGASFTAVGGAVFRLLSAERPFYLRPMPEGLTWRKGVNGMDWGTTEQHKATVVGQSLTSTGAVWYRKFWESSNGSSRDWEAAAIQNRKDIGANACRVDRSQSSEVDRLKDLGFDANTGLANVEARIGNMQSLILKRSVFFDARDPMVVKLFNQFCAYHRDEDGKIVEEDDDGVDAGLYGTSYLTEREYTSEQDRPKTMGQRYRQQREESSRYARPVVRG